MLIVCLLYFYLDIMFTQGSCQSDRRSNTREENYGIESHFLLWCHRGWREPGQGGSSKKYWVYKVSCSSLFFPTSRFYYHRHMGYGGGNVFTGVCHSVHRRGGFAFPQCHGKAYPAPSRQTPFPSRPPPPSQIRSTGVRYASYWNAYLCLDKVHCDFTTY